MPDCAVVALSADKVMGALRDAAAQGVKSAVVFASGFAELGAEGAALQRQFAELHAQTGLLVCGPNCLGLIDVHARTALYSAPRPIRCPPAAWRWCRIRARPASRSAAPGAWA